MKYIFLLILSLSAGISSEKDIFHLNGWEYAQRTDLSDIEVFHKDNMFLKSVCFNKKIYLFYKSDTYLYLSEFRDGSFTNKTIVARMERGADPVIKLHAGRIYVLTYHEGMNKFYYIDQDLSIQQLHQHISAFPFNYDFFPFDNVIILSHPVLIGGRFSVQLEVLIKLGNIHNIRVIDFPPLKEFEKGNFFPGITWDGSMYTVFYISRQKKPGDARIDDSLYKISTDNILDLQNQKATRIKASDSSDYPPSYLSTGSEDFIVYPSMNKAFYRLKLVSLKRDLEYILSPLNINVHSVDYIRRGDTFDFFYIGRRKNEAYIYRQSLDMTRIAEPAYVGSVNASRLSSSDYMINHMTVSSYKKATYIFFSPDDTNVIYFSRDDVSVPPLVLKLHIKNRTDDKSFQYVDFNWDEPDDPSGITGYAWVIDQVVDTIPGHLNLKADERYLSTSNHPPGDYHLHISAVDKHFNYSPAVHYPFTIGKGQALSTKIVVSEKKVRGSALHKAMEELSNDVQPVVTADNVDDPDVKDFIQVQSSGKEIYTGEDILELAAKGMAKWQGRLEERQEELERLRQSSNYYRTKNAKILYRAMEKEVTKRIEDAQYYYDRNNKMYTHFSNKLGIPPGPPANDATITQNNNALPDDGSRLSSGGGQIWWWLLLLLLIPAGYAWYKRRKARERTAVL